MKKNIFTTVKKHYEQKYENEYNPRAVRVALESAKKYGFDAGNSSTYNNEADAFKHTFASALVSCEEGYLVSFCGGFYHEFSNKGNSKNEYNMDTHNNRIGREISSEIKSDYGDKWNTFSDKTKEESIAERVWFKMQAGDLILDPSGRRTLKKIWEIRCFNRACSKFV
jgi:hypothetical protein